LSAAACSRPFVAELADASLDVVVEVPAIEGPRQVVARELALLYLYEDHEKREDGGRPEKDEAEVANLEGARYHRRQGKDQQGSQSPAVDHPSMSRGEDDDDGEKHVGIRHGGKRGEQGPSMVYVP